MRVNYETIFALEDGALTRVTSIKVKFTPDVDEHPWSELLMRTVADEVLQAEAVYRRASLAEERTFERVGRLCFKVSAETER